MLRIVYQLKTILNERIIVNQNVTISAVVVD